MTNSSIKLSRTLHTKTHKGKKRKNSSSRWIARHINDQYVESSKKLGYRSRAAFKLIEINDHFNIIRESNKILDLGASPGSWSQIASKISKTKLGTTNLVAVDLIELKPLAGIEFIQGDIYDDITIQKILALAPQKFDVILSDMAPNTTGHSATDHLKIISLAELTLELAKDLLKNHGNMVTKIFQGAEENQYIKEVRKYFKEVKRFKPNSSRKESSEIYIIAKNYRYEQED